MQSVITVTTLILLMACTSWRVGEVETHRVLIPTSESSNLSPASIHECHGLYYETQPVVCEIEEIMSEELRRFYE